MINTINMQSGDTVAKISVIVPVYNVEKIIDFCVNSIVSQTLQDLEIILVDDGSKDFSGAKCDEWAAKDSRITVFHQENAGQCAARNVGIENCHGEYIMFVDSDDTVNKDICRKLYNCATEHDADLSRCSYVCFSEYGKEVDTSDVDTGEVKVYTSREAMNNFVCAPYSNRKHFIPSVVSTLFRRELFDSVRFPEGLIYEEGFVLPKVFMKCRTLVHLDEQLYYYYMNPGGTMGSGFSEKGLKSIDDWKEIHALVADTYPELKVPTALRWIEKYITNYRKIQKRKDVDTDGRYSRYIINTLKENLPYFKTFLDKKDIRRVIAFTNGEGAYEKYLKRERLKTAIKTKLSVK